MMTINAYLNCTVIFGIWPEKVTNVVFYTIDLQYKSLSPTL